MNNFLEKIIDYKKQELKHLKRKVSLKDVRLKARDAEPARDFLAALIRASGGRSPSAPPAIIAEVKKASPSAGVIRPDFDPVKIAWDYEENGAAALSVLTDEHFFQGSLGHLERIKGAVNLPLLRKDFTLEEYHLYEARGGGADAVLLIVRILDDFQLKGFSDLSEELGMAALIEVHDEKELNRAIKIRTPLIGINNRDLDTFKVTLETTIRLVSKVPSETIIVSESGLSTRDDLKKLQEVGVHAFLIGESLLKSSDPGMKLREFLA